MTARSSPARVTHLDLTVCVPDALSAQRRTALQAMVEHCTVHNSLTTAPTIRVGLAA